MSIYATLWRLQFPEHGDDHIGCKWVEILAQAVPGHIGTPLAGYGYEQGDPYASFLPPPLSDDIEARNRAVVIVTSNSLKGTDRSAQEYCEPLLVLSGDEYQQIPFWKLHETICDLLRNESPRVVAQVFAHGTTTVIRDDGSINPP